MLSQIFRVPLHDYASHLAFATQKMMLPNVLREFPYAIPQPVA
jgi:hypothetical protein